MIAIHTKYIPATDTRGARIKAYTFNGHQITVPFDHDLSCLERHASAAKALIKNKLEYAPDHAVMAYGDSADGKGYVFCFTQSTVKLEG
jgi:hypothetical protein